MFYLGIDIGKNTHVASLMDEKAKVIFKAHSFSNTSDGAATLLEKITPYAAKLEIGMEATGHYWLSLYSFLIENNFVVHVINPIQTDGWRKGTEIRKRKTDIIDSVLIADLSAMAIFLKRLSLTKILCHCVIYHAFETILLVLLATLKEKPFVSWIKSFLNTIMRSLISLVKHQKNCCYS